MFHIQKLNVEEKPEIISFCLTSISLQFPEYQQDLSRRELPEWADDLGNIGSSNYNDYYSLNNTGSFLVLKNKSGEIVGTTGIMSIEKDWWCLKNIPIKTLTEYYQDLKTVCVLVRHYVKSDYMGMGLGKQLMYSITMEAKKMNYTNMHLYTHRNNSGFDSVKYFEKRGFTITYENENNVHMSKTI